MKENVGGADRALRFIAGPALIGLGLLQFGRVRRNVTALATIIAGVLTLESGITAVCPVNRLVGRDTS